MGNPGVSPYLGALVTMGLETGRDVTSFSLNDVVGDWAEEVRLPLIVGTGAGGGGGGREPCMPTRFEINI